jgi:hypothetical protein
MYLISISLDQVASGLRCDYKRNRGAGGAAVEQPAPSKGDGEAEKSDTLS